MLSAAQTGHVSGVLMGAHQALQCAPGRLGAHEGRGHFGIRGQKSGFSFSLSFSEYSQDSVILK